MLITKFTARVDDDIIFIKITPNKDNALEMVSSCTLVHSYKVALYLVTACVCTSHTSEYHVWFDSFAQIGTT